MKAEWKDVGYGFYALRFEGFTITVGWDNFKPKGAATTPREYGYKVSFESRTLLKLFPTLDEAKEAGIRFARRALKDALAALGE